MWGLLSICPALSEIVFVKSLVLIPSFVSPYRIADVMISRKVPLVGVLPSFDAIWIKEKGSPAFSSQIIWGTLKASVREFRGNFTIFPFVSSEAFGFSTTFSFSLFKLKSNPQNSDKLSIVRFVLIVFSI